MNTSWLAEIRVVTANGNMSNPTVPRYESNAQSLGGGIRQEVPRIDGKAVTPFFPRKPYFQYSLVHHKFQLLQYMDNTRPPPVIDLR